MTKSKTIQVDHFYDADDERVVVGDKVIFYSGNTTSLVKGKVVEINSPPPTTRVKWSGTVTETDDSGWEIYVRVTDTKKPSKINRPAMLWKVK